MQVAGRRDRVARLRLQTKHLIKSCVIARAILSSRMIRGRLGHRETDGWNSWLAYACLARCIGALMQRRVDAAAHRYRVKCDWCGFYGIPGIYEQSIRSSHE